MLSSVTPPDLKTGGVTAVVVVPYPARK